MRTSPYNIDLREKVINYIKQGNSQKKATEIFGLHRNTINRWWVRNEKEGNYKARERLGYVSKINKDEVAEYVENNPNTKLSEISGLFGMSVGHAGRIMKKMGYSYKKNIYLFGGKQRETR